jgi:hypothetical protein
VRRLLPSPGLEECEEVLRVAGALPYHRPST